MTADARRFDLHRAVGGRLVKHGGAAGDEGPDVRAGVLPERMGWRQAAIAAGLLVRDRPALIAVGLLGFLARGGLVVFLLPIVVLPTPIGISNAIGGTALTASGPSDGLIRLMVAGVVLVMGLVAVGATVGAVADLLLGRAAVTLMLAESHTHAIGPGRPAADPAGPAVPGTSPVLGRLIVVRIVALVPIAIAVAWATSRLVAAGYHQLILPDDLTVPLGVRILLEALDAAALVVAVWLIAEFLGGIAVRQVILAGFSIPGAAGATILAVARRPLASLATFVIGVLALAITAGPALLVSAVLWSRLQALLADGAPIVLVLPATFSFVLVWGGSLLAIGAVVAWRSLLGSLDVLRAARLASDYQGVIIRSRPHRR